MAEKILAEQRMMEGYELERDFPSLRPRAMCLIAREISCGPGGDTTILVGIEDVTDRRRIEREHDEMLRQKDILLNELQHRVANSLQIVASIILMKAKQLHSEESRRHLQDAHARVMSIAAVQQHLHVSGASGPVEIVPYLSKLCETLAISMVGDTNPVAMKVAGAGGCLAPRQAESLGLITIELVMNALKHAFTDSSVERQITVRYEAHGVNWELSVADNGVGKPDSGPAQSRTGLGTGIITALAQQLGARIAMSTSHRGTTVSIARSTPRASRADSSNRAASR